MNDHTELEGMHYEGNCIRPPSEAYSILLQVTVGCSHNKCTFCGTYKDKRFRIKDDETIYNDIRFAAKYMKRQDRVFLMDGDALIIPQKRLMWILDQIRTHLPWVRRVGAYANAKGIKMKTPEELKALRENGLGILYMGVETGDEDLLKKIRKGASPQHLIRMGRKVREAGIKLSGQVHGGGQTLLGRPAEIRRTDDGVNGQHGFNSFFILALYFFRLLIN